MLINFLEKTQSAVNLFEKSKTMYPENFLRNAVFYELTKFALKKEF